VNDLSALEPEQRSDALAIPLAKKPLNRPTTLLLSFLRAYVAFAVIIVIVAFVRALR
jgi:hypothetical protein